MAKHIKVRSNGSGDEDFDMYFPAFIVTVRDFTLDLELDGKEISADEYLEHALALRKENDPQSGAFNDTRMCIRRYFKSRKCFTFPFPVRPEMMNKLETLTDGKLDKTFVNNAKVFCDYVYEKCGCKKLETGEEVDGKMFGYLVRSYVGAVRNGAIPCIENALDTMAKQENGKAIEEALELYKEKFRKAVKLPTDHDEELFVAHHSASKDATAHFAKKAIYDKTNSFREKLKKELDAIYSRLKERNEDMSVDKTQKFLDHLNSDIVVKIARGVYTCSGGYKLYQTDLDQLQAKFKDTIGLGVKAKVTFLEFLNNKLAEGKKILDADRRIAAEEKKAEALRKSCIEDRRRQEIAELHTVLNALHMKNMQSMMNEHISQTKKKQGEELVNILNHMQEVLDYRLREQARLKQEGHAKQAALFQGRIDELEREVQQKRKAASCFADTSLVRVQTKEGKVCTVYLSELKVGDSVESFDFKTNQVVFSPVYFITHSTGPSSHCSPLLCLELEDGDNETRLRLDGNHLVYAAPREATPPRVPDLPVRANQAGIRHPMTMNHVIIVDNVLASVHMHYERIYRALTSPLRLLYAISPAVVQSDFVTSAVNAFDYIEKFL